jgi:hypothetical protein
MTEPSFSLMQGGLVHRLLYSTGALHASRRLSWWLAGVLVALSMLPLVVLTARDGTLLPAARGMALFGDYATLARLLLAMPLLVLAAPRADALLRNALRQLSHVSLVPASRQPRLSALLQRARAWRDGWFPEAICIALAYAPLLLTHGDGSFLPGVQDWRMQATQLSAAGQWHAWVAAPLFRLLTLLWLWRLVMWTLLLWRLPGVGLVLRAQHPDRTGGLAFLGLAQERFSILAASSSLVLAGACLNHMTYLGSTLYGMRHLVLGYVGGATLLLVAPLLVLTPAMVRARRHALYRFDALGSRSAAAFDQRWRAASEGIAGTESLLDHNDASAYADFSAVYQGVVAMSVVPVTRWNLLAMALPAALPMLPLLLVAMSVDELVAKLLGILA